MCLPTPPITNLQTKETPLATSKDEHTSQTFSTSGETPNEDPASLRSKPVTVPRLPLEALKQQLALEQDTKQDSLGSKEELEVDDTQAVADELDYDDNEETANPISEGTSAPAVELEKPKSPGIIWKNTGHSTYVKVDSNLASKGEELNEDAEELIQTLTSDNPTYP
jgi:hypothetical protein